MAIKVGSFAKSTGGAPASQAVTGVGFTPKALIMWTSGATSADATHDGYTFGIGVAIASVYGSVSGAAQDNQDTTVTSRSTQPKALTIVQWGETTLAECNLTSFDADGFTLSWTTNDANAYIINYMALGGPNLTNANVVNWTMATSTGNKAVTGAGFQPDCVFHIWSRQTSDGVGAANEIGIGIMTASAVWASSITSDDNAGTTNAGSAQTTSYPLYRENASLIADFSATYVSMDADGFTVNFDNGASSANKVFSLCLKGGSYFVGTFNKVQSPTNTQSITGVGFQPEGVLFHSSQVNADTAAVNGISYIVGASDGSSEVSAIVTDQDNVGTSEAKGYSSSTKAVSCMSVAGFVLALCDVSGLDADGFSLNWTTNDAQVYRIRYFAFNGGAAPSGQPIALRDWVRHTGRPWRPQRGL